MKRKYPPRAWKRCSNCGKKTRRICYIKEERLCDGCRRSRVHILGTIPKGKLKRKSTSVGFNKRNFTLLKKRLNYLYGRKSKKKSYNGFSDYVRKLIEWDLNQFNDFLEHGTKWNR